jgi:hypothetical protein
LGSVDRRNRNLKGPDGVSLRLVVILAITAGAALLVWRMPTIAPPLTLAVTVYLVLDHAMSRR